MPKLVSRVFRYASHEELQRSLSRRSPLVSPLKATLWFEGADGLPHGYGIDRFHVSRVVSVCIGLRTLQQLVNSQLSKQGRNNSAHPVTLQWTGLAQPSTDALWGAENHTNPTNCLATAADGF